MKKMFWVILIVAVVVFGTVQVGASVNSNKAIGLDKGVNVALQDAGFKSEEVTGLTAHYDNDDGVATYEVDFIAGGFEYEYTIKAADGTIIEANREAAKTPQLSASEIKFEDPLPADPVQPQEPAKAEESAKAEEPAAPQTQTPSEPASKYIGIDKAKSIALKDAGLNASEVKFTKAKLDKDDGTAVYELEFYTGNTEYEYEINASTGTIRDKDFDREDGWDGDDDDDDEWDD